MTDNPSSIPQTVSVSLDKSAAQAAYEAYVERNADSTPWSDLSVFAVTAWQRVAEAVLEHITAAEKYRVRPEA